MFQPWIFQHRVLSSPPGLRELGSISFPCSRQAFQAQSQDDRVLLQWALCLTAPHPSIFSSFCPSMQRTWMASPLCWASFFYVEKSTFPVIIGLGRELFKNIKPTGKTLWCDEEGVTLGILGSISDQVMAWPRTSEPTLAIIIDKDLQSFLNVFNELIRL